MSQFLPNRNAGAGYRAQCKSLEDSHDSTAINILEVKTSMAFASLLKIPVFKSVMTAVLYFPQC